MTIPSSTRVVTTVAELRNALAPYRRAGQLIGLAPTMGALHEGHLSLVRASKAECAVTVVTIFVNPTQFAPTEDLAKYPRTLAADLEKLASCGADFVLVPSTEEVYRPGHDTWVVPGGVAEPLEGQVRPGHFRGVATVVLKLFNMAQPDIAYFGQKDYQQALVIRRMVADLDVPVTVRVCPTVREPDGLAMSSRNVYLSPEARQRATVLWKSLQLAQELVAQGERDAATIAARMREVILFRSGAFRRSGEQDPLKRALQNGPVPQVEIDYIALVDPETLQPVEKILAQTLAALAVRIEGPRLIDNCLLYATNPLPHPS